MCILDFSVVFKLEYKCEYGKSVYVVGNVETLGNWNPLKGFKLDWSEGHIWSKKVIITHDNTKPIEYKYIVAPTDFNSSTFDARWEDGSNRQLNLQSISKLFIELDDEWEHRKIRIALHDLEVKDYLGPDKGLYLETYWGWEKKSIPMKIRRQKFGDKHQYNFWSASLQVPWRVCEFQYRFKVENEDGRLKTAITQSCRTFSFKNCCSSKRGETFYLLNGGTLTKFDFSLHLPLGFNKITDQIYVGEFPKTELDVEALASKNIRGVLNLQTHEDMKRYAVDWAGLKKHYQKFNIDVEHLPITDMDTDELTLKIQDAADAIHKLIQQNQTVYVHCTAGKYRSPHAVIFYLWHYKKYELETAISLVKSKRKRTKIFEKVFNQKVRS